MNPQKVDTPVYVEPIFTGAQSGGMDFLTFALILGVGLALVLGALVWSKVSALAMFREYDYKQDNDNKIYRLEMERKDQEHRQEHRLDAITSVVNNRA